MIGLLRSEPLPGLPRGTPSWILALPMPGERRLLFAWLWVWRKRLVNPSVPTIARMLRRTDRTVQRHLEALTAEGYVLRLYNGGKGKQCVYFLGPKARQLAETEPAWDVTYARGAKTVQALGSLRLGRVAKKRKGDTGVTLTDVHSSCLREDPERESEGGKAPPMGAPAALELRPRADSPPAPHAGGGAPVAPAAAAPTSPAETTTARAIGDASSTPAGLRPPIPPDPPGGAKKKRLGATEGRGEASRTPFWEAHPELWRKAWAIWRPMYLLKHKGEQPLPDIRDAKSMAALIRQGLFWAQGDQDQALRYVSWGFREHLRQRENRHQLWLVLKYRVSYDRPPATWKTPTAEDFERWKTRLEPREPDLVLGPTGRLVDRAQFERRRREASVTVWVDGRPIESGGREPAPLGAMIRPGPNKPRGPR